MNVTVDALVENVVINGVDITEFVNEHDPWYPLRGMLRPTTSADMRATWAAIEAAWAETTSQALALPEAALHDSVNGEFTFVESLRHVVFATDKWFTAPILAEPLHPIGLPNNGSLDFPFPGLDLSSAPKMAEALQVRADRVARVRRFLEAVTQDQFGRSIDILENGPHPLLECLYTVFEEEFWHNRYVRRDLAILAERA